MSTNSDTNQASWELPEAVWQRMESLMPPRKSTEGRPQTVDLKRMTEGSFSVLRTGIQWQACPRERFGPPNTVYDCFRQWVTSGVLGQLWAVALTVYDDLKGLEWTWQRVDGMMTTAPLGEATGPNPTDRSVGLLQINFDARLMAGWVEFRMDP